MFKIVIIDDDAIIRKGLSTTIPWEQLGFTLSGVASNGEKGYLLIKEVKPDLVVTDIKMPFVDGLELTEKVTQEFPEIKIIMLTSYDDFDYAKRALQLKVFDYLVKPVENELLVQTANRAMEEMEYEHRIRNKVIEAKPLLRQQFLEKWIEGKLSKVEAEAEAEFLGLTLPATHYVVILLKADDYSYTDYQNRFGKEMLKYCILNVAEETVGSVSGGLVFDSLADEAVLICFIDGDKDQVEQRAFEIAEEIRSNVEKYLKTTITAGIGYAYDDCMGVSLSYLDARSALEFRHILGRNRVMTVEDTGFSAQLDLSDLQKELILKVKLGLEKEALAITDNMERMIIETRFISLTKVRLVSLETVLLLYKEIEYSAKQTKELDELYMEFQQLQTVSEMFLCIRKVIVQITALVNRQREGQMKQVITQAMEYIEEHYAQERLSLQDVAQIVHISPTYLSIIFKKEKQINFSDYLLQVRMNAAMKLLRLTDLKTYEVAERVGFSNAQYFSVCFKKYAGMSPTEFKS